MCVDECKFSVCESVRVWVSVCVFVSACVSVCAWGWVRW